MAGITGMPKHTAIAEPKPVPVPIPTPDVALDIRNIKVPEMIDATPKGVITTTLEITPEFTPTPEPKEIKQLNIEKNPAFEKPFKYENVK